MTIALSILQDAFFGAVAGVGFASISNPRPSALPYCAVISGAGHAARFCLMTLCGTHIIPASLAAAILVGFLSVALAKRAKYPPETFSFPSLLPMIPGMYAYRTFQAMFMCMTASDEPTFAHYFHLLGFNGLTTILVVLAMVVGQLLPLMVMKRLSFTKLK